MEAIAVSHCSLAYGLQLQDSVLSQSAPLLYSPRTAATPPMRADIQAEIQTDRQLD